MFTALVCFAASSPTWPLSLCIVLLRGFFTTVVVSPLRFNLWRRPIQEGGAVVGAHHSSQRLSSLLLSFFLFFFWYQLLDSEMS